MVVAKNNHEQYTWCNNIKIQSIPATVANEHLEDKVTDIFRRLKINNDPSNIGNCHTLSTWTTKNTKVQFVNCKYCKKALEARFDLQKINNTELYFNNSSVLYFSENLTPYNQYLASKCRELKRANLVPGAQKDWLKLEGLLIHSISRSIPWKGQTKCKIKNLRVSSWNLFYDITNPWNVSKSVLTNSFTRFESIMVELAVSITNQSANRNFSLILNSYNVLCNHTSSHVFLPQNTCKLSKFII